MSEQFSEELLSAYVDGELSPQLRAAVERWVENSPEARQKVEDFRRLSGLFGDLSRTEVPPEFSTEVLHLAERRMLLPEASAVNGRIRIRRWVLRLAAPTAAAAVLVVVFTIANFNDRANKPSAPGRAIDVARPGNFDDYARRGGSEEQPNMLVAQDESPSHSADRPIVGGAGGALAPSAAPAAGSPRPSILDASLGAPAGPLTSDAESDRQLQALNEALDEIRDSGAADKLLLVVRVKTIDWAEGLFLMQKDFAANDIRIESVEAVDGKAANVAKPKGEASPEGLYVEAQADAVIAGFKTTLARRHPGLRFTVDDPIELASLDAESQKKFLLGDVGQSVDRELRRGDDAAKESKDVPERAKPAASRSMPSAASADKVAKADDSDTKANKKSSPSATQRKDSPSGSNSRPSQPSGPSNGTVEKHLSVPPPSENESDVAEKESPVTRNQTANSARQMAVPLEIQNRPRSNSGSNSRSGRNATNSQKQQSPATPGEAKSRDVKPLAPGDEKMDEPAPALVRMLIVIEREPQEPAAPAAKKDPSGGAS